MRDPKRVTPDFRFGSRLCENSNVQLACRIFRLDFVAAETNCTGNFCRKKAIEKIILRVESVGTATAAAALIVSGRNHAIESCRSPKAEVGAARTMIERTEEALRSQAGTARS